MTGVPRNQILVGDVRERLDDLPADSIDCVVTSPPYFQLRDYGTDEQIGLESHVDEWVEELRLVMRSLRRVVKGTGSVWLNLGDTYSRHAKYGAQSKSLLLGPERLALKLIDDGWHLRNKVVWAKRNTLPTGTKDRLACTWEVMYFLTPSPRYFFDLDAIRVPHLTRPPVRRRPARSKHGEENDTSWRGTLSGKQDGLQAMKARGVIGHPLGKNPGDVLHLTVSNFRGRHHATFPESLVLRPLLATCPERVCVRCMAPWIREPYRTETHNGTPHAVRGDFIPGCGCNDANRPGVVLDPFFGSGTVGVVAEAHGRDWIGVEINPAYAEIATKRIETARKGRS